MHSLSLIDELLRDKAVSSLWFLYSSSLFVGCFQSEIPRKGEVFTFSRLWLGKTQTAGERIFFLLLHHLSGSQNLAGYRWDSWTGRQRQLPGAHCMLDKQGVQGEHRPNSMRARHTTG